MVKKLVLIFLVLYTSINSSGCAILKFQISNFKFQRGEVYAHKRQYKKAESTLIKALEYNPKNTKAWIALGDTYFTIEDYEGARYAYQEALRYDEDAFNAYAGLWQVRLEETGYTEEVRREVKREIEDLISLGDKRPERLMAAYYGLLFLHEYDQAARVGREIMTLEPDEETVSVLSQTISEEILREKDIEKRLKMAEDFLALFPMSRERYRVQSIRLNIATKDLKDKEMLYKYGEDWIRNEPENRRANFSVGYYYTEADVALNKAVSYIRKALNLIEDPDPADKPVHYPELEWQKDLRRVKGTYYDTLGWAYYKLGRYRAAEKAYRMATKYLDYDQNLYYHYGLLLEERGDTEGAIKSYVQALKSGENKEAEGRLVNLWRINSPSPPFNSLPLSESPSLIKGGEGELECEKSLSKFFAQKEGITTFTDVTEAAGLSGVKASRVAWGDYTNDGYEDILFDGAILFKNNGDGTFKDVTMEGGITAIPGASGGVWGDFNNDGYIDFYTFASGKGTTDRFWRNNGNGTFRDITATALKEPDGYPTEAAAWGDYDNDGFIDLYVANYERPLLEAVERARCTPDRLLHNNGNGTFTDVSHAAGVVSLEKMCGMGVSWGDYDNDGDLDIYVANYRLDPNFLWRNNGNGTFTNVATEAGVEGSEEEGYYGHSTGAEWGDYDNDGDMDLFVSNLAHPRYIGISDKSMLLENQGPLDLTQDYLFLSGEEETTQKSLPPSGGRDRLALSEAEGVGGGIGVFRFINRFADSGIRFEETSADPAFADYDNDGILDLYFTSTYEGRKSFLYKGNGAGTFSDVTWLAGVRVDNGWGNAFADYDNDGDLDLLVGSPDGVKLFRNDGNNNHWLHVRVVGRTGLANPAYRDRGDIFRFAQCKHCPVPLSSSGSNRAGIGARITMVPGPFPPREGGSRWGGIQIREVQGGKGSGSQHSLPVEFGLGTYSGPVDVEVRFPSGKVVKVKDIEPDQRIVVEE